MSSRPPWEVDDTPPWEVDDTSSSPKKASNPFSMSRRPLSAWEEIQQGATSAAGGALDFLKGLGLETAAVVNRTADMPNRMVAGAMSAAADATGLSKNPDVSRALILKEEADYKRRKWIDDLIGQKDGASLSEKAGRVGARVAPQVVLGALTGGASVPIEAAVLGGSQALQSISEGASPGEAAVAAGLSGAGSSLARGVNAGINYLRAPFKKYVNPAAQAAFERLGITPPASAISDSPIVQQAEGLASKFIGGGDISRRTSGAAQDILGSAHSTMRSAGDPEAILAGRNIGEGVVGAQDAAATRQAMTLADEEAFNAAQQQARRSTYQSIRDPQGAAEAGPLAASGYRSTRGAARAANEALYADTEALAQTPTPLKDALARIDELLANPRGSMSPRDLADLRRFRNSIAPRRTIDIGNGPEAVDALHPAVLAMAEKQGIPISEAPRMGNEVRSALVGLRQKVPYGQGGDALFGNDALRQRVAGIVADALDADVSAANPELARALRGANAHFADTVDPFKSQWGRQIARAIREGRLSDIPDVLSPRTAPEDVATILKTVGPDAAGALRANVLERITAGARDAAGNIDPVRLGRELEGWGNAESILSPGQMRELRSLAKPLAEFPKVTGPTAGPQTAPEMLSGRWGKAVRGQYEGGRLGEVVPTVVRPNSPEHEIQAALSAAATPEARREVQANAIKRVLGIGPQDDLSKISPDSLRKNIQSWGGRKKLLTFLEPDQVQAIMDIYQAAQAMGRTGKITGGSQTSFLQNLARLPERFADNPLKAMRSLGLEIVASKAIGSEGGQKWLTTGLAPVTLPGRLAGAPLRYGARVPSERNLLDERRRAELDALVGSGQ